MAEHARLVVNLPFERLREDGKIAQAVRSAINGALRKSLISDQRGMLSAADVDATEDDAMAAGDESSAAPVEAFEQGKVSPVLDETTSIEAPAQGRVSPSIDESARVAGLPMMAFSWGYYGWGTHTPELIEMMDRVEASRGFGPPRFVDVRLRRQVRAIGFREKAFEKLLGPDRHTWLPGLGNRMIADRELEEQTLDDPKAINDLLAIITRSATEGRRVIFFCSCSSPFGRPLCHRGLVVDLLVKTARAQKLPLAVQEWPGGSPVIATIDIPKAQMAKLLPLALEEEAQAARLPLPEGMSLAMAGTLPHLSLLRCRSGEDEVVATAGPVIATVRGWAIPVHVVNEQRELKAPLLKNRREQFAETQLGPMGAAFERPAMWREIDLMAEK